MNIMVITTPPINPIRMNIIGNSVGLIDKLNAANSLISPPPIMPIMDRQKPMIRIKPAGRKVSFNIDNFIESIMHIVKIHKIDLL